MGHAVDEAGVGLFGDLEGGCAGPLYLAYRWAMRRIWYSIVLKNDSPEKACGLVRLK
jgi:hypothetical protein